jgi:hypothetical protein
MKTNTVARLCFSGFVLAVIAFCWEVPSQTFTPQPVRKVPTDTGSSLLADCSDLRRHFFDQQTIESRVRRGVVSLLRQDFIATGRVEERSTNEWLRVSDVLRIARQLDRKGTRPQIRVVQRDSILQSRIGFPSISQGGFSPAFLERQLEPGDIVVVTLLTD